ncbi:5'-nucleotidase C-terminal domain-containing protein [Kocuria sp.]|uniref:5'-nucleotidase C-terminal domain-containing protein n=1 Tax=Kocuria sp. TaxID=1871328 RepID=UPI0026DF33A9|nr:5'-nucleotidase C-terminal domain-containing protein [Kocuria sp.]MDO5617991.1 5'-nucleotidase C-terminal domain-containing protein [Kocuria sp.]
MSRRTTPSFIAALAAGILTTTSFVVPAYADETPSQAIDLLYFNDYHGRLDSRPVQFAGAIESERTDNSLLISGGDNIGASEYTSASQQDNPTLDMLNALDLDVSAVGNHEFDQGRDDLTGRVTERAEFPYLAANVRIGDANGPLLMEGEGHQGNGAYELFERDGVTIAVIGAVTQATPEKVAPSAVEGLVFTDPVAEVNAVADRLDEEGTADVIVAAYHDGSATQAEAASDRFWTETSQSVDVVFGGDSHAEYNLTQDVDGDGVADRAYMQTGSYGANVGKVSFTYDPATDSVDLTSTLTPTSQIVAGRSEEQLIAAYPRVAEVNQIVDAAVAVANEIGSTPAGEISADITTAFGPNSSGQMVRDDRQNESALGNLIAQGFRAQLADSHGVDIGVINPGGIRNELYYADNPDETIDGDRDGMVTEAEINNVLPFANNMNTIDLTGAQFKSVLEQQWQPAGSSRAFLHLGLSENVQYTFDESRPAGDRITSITVDGTPIDPTGTYTVASVSFLLDGGDGFTAFTEGANFTDTGLIDRQVFSEHLGETSASTPVAPQFDRRAVNLSNVRTDGTTVSFELQELNMTSLGAPANSTVQVRKGGANGSVIAEAPVSGEAVRGADGLVGGTASVSFDRTALDGETAWLTVEPAGTALPLTDAVLGEATPVDPEPETVTFTDVTEGMQHYEHIMWMAQNGISRGWVNQDTGTAEFRPLRPVNRDAMAAFLYRMAGEPEVTLPANSPFTDVTPGQAHYQAIVWAQQEGIVKGWSDGTFRPTQPIARDAMAAFLYRMAGEPAVELPANSPFVDVNANMQHYTAMVWMAQTGLSTGWADGTYRPFSPTNRDATAAFLHRFDQQFEVPATGVVTDDAAVPTGN